MSKTILIGSDGNSAYAVTNGARTITLSGLSFTPSIEQVALVFNKTQDKLYYAPAPGIALCSISGSVITIDSTFPVLVTGDEVHIQLYPPNYGTDEDGYPMVNILNPLYSQYTSPETLAAAEDIGFENDVWIDQGEVPCNGYKAVGIWVILTVNDSTGNQLQILSKQEGADEYVLETSAVYHKTLGDSDIKIVYPFAVEGVPLIKIQTKATELGITAAYMTGSNNHQPSFAVWEAVTDGSFRITLNGVAYNIDGIDFTGITDLAGVATVARTALRAAVGDDTLGLIYTVPGFIFTANDNADSSITALETSTGTVGTDISGFPSANNIWFDAYGSDGVVTPAAGTVAVVTIDITKEY